MIPELRKQYNAAFTDEKYQSFLNEFNATFPGALAFHIAETPVFVPDDFARKMYDACDSIIDYISSDLFKEATERAIPVAENTPGEDARPQILVFDFGVCTDDKDQLVPQLIEMQGFPSLFGFQSVYPNIFKKHLPIPDNFSHYLGAYDQQSFEKDFQELLLNGHAPEEVILLEIKPHEQKTKIDFYCTEKIWGIHPVCITEVYAQGGALFYTVNGKAQRIKRIYNRVIFDELHQFSERLNLKFEFNQLYDVEWLPHPNWFYRVSKFTLPFLQHPYIPETHFLHELQPLPADLENYVIKPLFSFAGQGVIIDVTQEDIDNIKDPENWIIQKKVQYKDVIVTPDSNAKAEIRLMYIWKNEWDRPRPAINLARLSKGKMIGIRYNQNKTWVGGSVAMFEKK